MKLLLFINRVKEKIERAYRKNIFKEYISCEHKDFSLVGKITTINKNIKLGHNVTIYPGCMFFGDGIIEIGNNVDIGNNTIIYSSKNGGGVYIGDNTMIAANCYIIDADHATHIDKLIREQENVIAPVKIGKDCWLATNVTVLKGAIVEDGVVVGAKALVNGKLEKNSICVGIPAKTIKYRT